MSSRLASFAISSITTKDVMQPVDVRETSAAPVVPKRQFRFLKSEQTISRDSRITSTDEHTSSLNTSVHRRTLTDEI